MTPVPSPLLVVTDRHLCQRPLEDVVRDAIDGGARWFWLRDRDMEPTGRRRLALRLAGIVRAAGGVLSIGGDIELARDAGTGAVHVREIAAIRQAKQRLGAASLVGYSAHGVAEAGDARDAGADYVTLSPIHPTASKPGYGPALGPGAIMRTAQAGVPVLALGGIDAGTAAAAMSAGAKGVAVMGGVMRAQDPAACVRAMLAGLVPHAAARREPGERQP